MEYSREDFVTVEEILADVIANCNDEDFRVRSKGFYVSHIQQALEKLSFDTYFSKKNVSFDIPDNLRLPLPKGMFNIRQMYLFNGDECNIERAQNVYHKANFINGTSGSGYVANNTGRNQRDPFYGRRFDRQNSRNPYLSRNFEGDDTEGEINNLFYFGIQDGLIMLSSRCKNFSKLMIVFNGVHTNVGDEPIIPLHLREAVRDHVSVVGTRARMTDADPASGEFQKWFQLHNMYKEDLNKPFDGSWARAEYRVKTLGSKERQDLKEYLSKLDI